MTSIDSATHQPVMAQRCVELVGQGVAAYSGENPVLIDATLGLGGHSQLLLEAFPTATLLGIDRDLDAIARSEQRLARFGDRFSTVHTTYDQIERIVAEKGISSQICAILMDLGVSSLQLDVDERGFSYARDTYLDMRMDQSQGMTAAQLLAITEEKEIARILRVYGDERFAPRIAKRIVQQRSLIPITRSQQLVDLIRQAIPAATRRQGGNPAKRTFQALRIAVNNELQILEQALNGALSVLAPGGVLVVEAYQSLEDRLVKAAFKTVTEISLPSGIPLSQVEIERQIGYRILTRGSEKASAEEKMQNSRSQSVRLRAIQKLNPQTTTISKGENR